MPKDELNQRNFRDLLVQSQPRVFLSYHESQRLVLANFLSRTCHCGLSVDNQTLGEEATRVTALTFQAWSCCHMRRSDANERSLVSSPCHQRPWSSFSRGRRKWGSDHSTCTRQKVGHCCSRTGQILSYRNFSSAITMAVVRLKQAETIRPQTATFMADTLIVSNMICCKVLKEDKTDRPLLTEHVRNVRPAQDQICIVGQV